MLKKIKKYIVTPKKITGVEVVLNKDGQYCFNTVLLQKKKDQLSIISTRTNIRAFEELYKTLDQKIPLALNFTGKGIFHKKINSTYNSTEEALKEVLPDSRLDDFAYQLYNQENIDWLCISRKDVLETLTNELVKRKFQIISISLGIAPIYSLLPFLSDAAEIILPQYIIKTNGKEILDIQTNNHSFAAVSFNIGSEKIDALSLLPFATAFQSVVHSALPLYGFVKLENYKVNYFHTQLFNKIGFIFLLLLFVVLLGNYLAFSWLNQQNSMMTAQLSYHDRQLSALDSLKKELNEQRDFLNENAVLSPSKLSFYTDQIGVSLPIGIKLREMNIFPTIKSTQREDEGKFLFDNQIINLKGTCRESIILNNWIRSLKELSWVKEVTVLPYSETSSGVGDFEIQITIQT